MNSDALGNFRGKRLVVFGAGYVGSALTEMAATAGLAVTALTRNADTAGRLRSLGVRVVCARLQERDWHAAIGEQDWVVNCVSSGGGGEAGYRESYVEGFASILSWLRQCRGKPDTLVYTSSTSVYPQSDGMVDEGSSTDAAVGTAKILLEAEQLARRAVDEGDCRRAVVLRVAGIYGPGRHQLLDQLRAGAAVLAGSGEHLLNLAHRDDIVGAIGCALASSQNTKTADEIFNVADDHPSPKKEVVAWLAGELKIPPPSFSGVTSSTRRASMLNRAVSNAKLKRVLGWAPLYPDFRAGYRAILQA